MMRSSQVTSACGSAQQVERSGVSEGIDDCVLLDQWTTPTDSDDWGQLESLLGRDAGQPHTRIQAETI